MSDPLSELPPPDAKPKRKAAAKQAPAPVPAEPAPPAAKKAARKTAVKQTPVAETPPPPPLPMMVEPPAAKPAAKKTLKRIVKVATVVEEAPPPSVVIEDPKPPAKKAARKSTKTAAAAAPTESIDLAPEPPAEGAPEPTAPAAQGPDQGPPLEGGSRKFRKSWKQRKYEKYLKRKAEREERMRAEGPAPASVQRPQPPPRLQPPLRPQHPQHSYQQPRPHPNQRPREPREFNRETDDWDERELRPDPNAGPPEPTAGLLEISAKGFGFIRVKKTNFAQSPTDAFVTPEMVRNLGLRDGVWLEGDFLKGPRGPQITELRTVNGLPPDHYRQLPIFEELTAINPNKRYVLETEEGRSTMRLVDMIAPIGRGQRGLIVAAPRAGKTTFLEHMAQAILKNYAEVKLIVLLVDERPEEVTELTRALPGAEIMASSNDADPRAHIRMAQLAIERAKRLVEAGEHVFMLMDSITRLARAFNQAMKGGGKAMSGGIDARALEMPRKIFAAARNTREAGSLTIIATALIETNNKGDDLIFQEFKGTGNMELVLDRKIAQQYVYPAVDIFKSGTRREELLLPPYQLEKINVIRRGLAGHKPIEAVERLIHFLNRFKNNNELLMNIATKNG